MTWFSHWFWIDAQLGRGLIDAVGIIVGCSLIAVGVFLGCRMIAKALKL